MTFPCDWPISYSACSVNEVGIPLCFEGMSAAEQTMIEEIAVEFLANWTGRTFGLCSAVVRPCRSDCTVSSSYWGKGPFPEYGTGGYTPVLIGGLWFNIGCGYCSGELCGCSETPILKMPGPIYDINQIKIDDVVLDPDAYRVDNYNLLVRQDGYKWPTCQDFSVGGGVGSFIVDYVKGVPTPAGGQIAAGLLACELGKAICADKTCALPERMKQITRQGVSVTVLDDFKSLNEGQTGLWLIDSWVASVMKPPRRSRVFSVDVPRPKPRITTWRAMHGGAAFGGVGHAGA